MAMMRFTKAGLGALFLSSTVLASLPDASNAQTDPKAGSAAKEAPKDAAAAPAGGDGKKPRDVVQAAEKGTLKNPHKSDPGTIEAGKKLYLSYGCNGCHGMGGGGMGPPLSNPTWVYGDDDDTLFRLVVLGTDELQKQGYSRKGTENVVGPMPHFGDIIKTGDDLWKMIIFMRSTSSQGK